MLVFERVSEIVTQVAGIATISIVDVLSSAFMLVVLFFLDLLLGL